MRSTCKAYTLIELAVLIGILGTVGALAYPRYVVLETNVNRALVRNLGNNIQSTAMVAHFLWLAQDEPDTVVMLDRSVGMTNGYPDHSSIDDALMNYSGFEFTAANIAQFKKIDAKSPASCKIAYAAAAQSATPLVRIFTNGC